MENVLAICNCDDEKKLTVHIYQAALIAGSAPLDLTIVALRCYSFASNESTS
jgi:hypothetical protein